MKERKIQGLDVLRMLEDGRWCGRWIGCEGDLNAGGLFGVLETIFRYCHWLRKSGKTLSEKSKTDYVSHIKCSFNDLRELGFNLQKPWNLEQKHIASLCSHWSEKGLSPSTVQNRLMALSWFGAVVGRPGLVRGTHDYKPAYGNRSMRRDQVTKRDRSPLGAGIDATECVARADALDATFGMMVRLQLALGLRDKEVVRARPLRDMFWGDAKGLLIAEGETKVRERRRTQTTDALRSYWRLPPSQGSKGGRARVIECWQGPEQESTIRAVCEFLVARGKSRGLSLSEARDQSLGWSSLVSQVEARHRRLRKTGERVGNSADLVTDGEVGNIADWPATLAQDMRRYRHLSEKAGFTKTRLGFTPHGFRHYFALRELEARGFRAEIAEGDSDVSRDRTLPSAGDLGLSDEEMASLMRYAVSRQLGHARSSVTAAYYGKHIISNAPGGG